MRTIIIKVHGKVQGVFFRANTEEKAKKLGLKGFVKNESNPNQVTIHAQGRRIQELLNFIKTSPGSSKVEKTEIEEIDEDKYPDFQIKR